MRSITRTIALTVTLALASSATPALASAQPREPRLRNRDTVVRVIQRIVKRFFSIGATADEMSPPKPTTPVTDQE